MEKLVIEKNKEDFYKLEVNDNGDYIEFDLLDMNLPKKIMMATENIRKYDKEMASKMIEISNLEKKDEKVVKIIEVEDKYNNLFRKEFDSFLGDGACQKIFGDKNSYGQFVKLLNALDPHLAKMKINISKAKKTLASKYLKDDKGII